MKIYIIGIGPGAYSKMTMEAVAALKNSDIIVGYEVYVDLVRPYFSDKEFLSTPMRKEVERCELAFEQASLGKIVGFVCSGDAGVYGLAGIFYSLSHRFPDVELEVVPGVTAALSGAAVLGAPLIHDFAVISLSDLLTPMEKIEKRLRMAAEGDFVIVLYNPSSKKRADYLQRACRILLESKDGGTKCAVVRNIARNDEEARLYTLDELQDAKTDMFCTVFIGNSQTEVVNGKLVTPRGYQLRNNNAKGPERGDAM